MDERDFLPRHMVQLSLIDGEELKWEMSGFSTWNFWRKRHLDEMLGNRGGHFTVFSENFSKSAQDVRLEGNVLKAQLRTRDGSWREDQVEIRVARVPEAAKKTVTLALGIRNVFYPVPSCVCHAARQYPLLEQGPQDDCRNLRISRCGRFIIALCKQTDGHYRAPYIELDRLLTREGFTFDNHHRLKIKCDHAPAISHLTIYAGLEGPNGDIEQSALDLGEYLGCRDGRLIALAEDKPKDSDITLAAARSNEEATAPMPSGTPIYTPLENKGMIRVCEIAKGKWDDPISCRLICRALDGAEPYTCVSYTWGSMANSCSITLNQHPFSIGRNLFRLLRRLRCRGATSTWIDALSINQSNHAEKSVQVAQMGTIYSKAEKVFIWLGEDVRARVQKTLQYTTLSAAIQTLSRFPNSISYC